MLKVCFGLFAQESIGFLQESIVFTENFSLTLFLGFRTFFYIIPGCFCIILVIGG